MAFLANPDTYNTAEPTEWVISTYLEPRDYEPVRIYAAQGGNTAAVTAAVNTGCLFVTYMGHSGSNGWWDPAFNQSNVNAAHERRSLRPRVRLVLQHGPLRLRRVLR